ncbi:hypothetical protein [Aliirhizobium smilacinae]|uniref:Uncharacterized protein n=1 Tax=Aliirhizobium smilacinae TaxID=1395944 RepID=A0A5C4XS64_9HYPH|nr:hypothetical protein [Rhizobium smilacinae]TNM65881.1 hypothetical protein FHP24_06530 [Rhizobium smilacinae]
MLDGRKPLTIHSGERGFDPFETGRSCFRPHVENGRIIERITSVQGGGRSFLTLYYALPGQEWRFDAYDELMNGPRPWTEAMERRLGMLLGYTDEECDWWIANGFRHTSPIATS